MNSDGLMEVRPAGLSVFYGEDGHMWLGLRRDEGDVFAIVCLGVPESAALLARGILRSVEAVTVPDDASALAGGAGWGPAPEEGGGSWPTPRDVFGGGAR